MKAYGLSRADAGDDDKGGCGCHARNARMMGRERALHSLRRGRKKTTRRLQKRAARRVGKRECFVE